MEHSANVRGDFAQAVLDRTDAGSGAGYINLTTAINGGGTILATITLSDPSHTRSGAVLTYAGTPISTTAIADGTIAGYAQYDSDDNLVHSGSAGTSGTDVIVDNTSVVTGQTINLLSSTYTASV